jgi:hypothetical protein
MSTKFGYYDNLFEMPKANNRPLGENSPNLVTLMALDNWRASSL